MKYSIFILVVLFMSCSKQSVTVIENTDERKFLHLAHTRTSINPQLVETAQMVDFQQFDMLLLGGDLALHSSESDETMNFLDSIFNFGNPNTLWALGNHDYPNLDRIEQFTQRPNFFSYHNNGITFLVLDTQDDFSKITGEQKELVQSVTDTISLSSHLVVLHHKLIWMYDHPELNELIDSTSNGMLGDCFYCLNPNNFYSDIYPMLTSVKDKDIEVLCVAGDIGFKTQEFEYLSEEGIYFLASGVNNDSTIPNCLLFKHNVKTQILEWEFVNVSEAE